MSNAKAVFQKQVLANGQENVVVFKEHSRETTRGQYSRLLAPRSKKKEPSWYGIASCDIEESAVWFRRDASSRGSHKSRSLVVSQLNQSP